MFLFRDLSAESHTAFMLHSHSLFPGTCSRYIQVRKQMSNAFAKTRNLACVCQINSNCKVAKVQDTVPSASSVVCIRGALGRLLTQSNRRQRGALSQPCYLQATQSASCQDKKDEQMSKSVDRYTLQNLGESARNYQVCGPRIRDSCRFNVRKVTVNCHCRSHVDWRRERMVLISKSRAWKRGGVCEQHPAEDTKTNPTMTRRLVNSECKVGGFCQEVPFPSAWPNHKRDPMRFKIPPPVYMYRWTKPERETTWVFRNVSKNMFTLLWRPAISKVTFLIVFLCGVLLPSFCSSAPNSRSIFHDFSSNQN